MAFTRDGRLCQLGGRPRRLSPPVIPEAHWHRDDYDWQRTKTGLTLIRIRAGKVERPEDPEYRVVGKTIRVENDFWLSDREVTVREFLGFLNDRSYQFEKPDKPTLREPLNDRDKDRPVTGVSWYDAVLFCNWLSRQDGRELCYAKEGKEQIEDNDGKTREYDAWKLFPGANGYRLPTEDEWEYACRARTTTAFCFGDADELLDRYAVFSKNANNGEDLVGRKLCNAWGLFDGHGNVWEWCLGCDREGSDRVLRGGSWLNAPAHCRSANRNSTRPTDRGNGLGFRVATVPSASLASPTTGARNDSR